MDFALLVNYGHGVAGRPHFAGAGYVVGSAGVAHQPIVQGRVGGQVGVHRVDPRQQDFPVGRMLADGDAGADGLAHPFQVEGFLVVIVIQVGVVQRVAGFEPQFALAQGQLQAGADADVVFVVVDDDLRRAVFRGHQQGRNLHIVAEVGIGDGVAQADLDGGRLDVGAVAGGAEQHAGGGMVAEVLSDAGQVVNHRDTHFAKVVGGADAGEQQQLGGGDGAAADDNPGAVGDESLPAACHFYAHGAFAVEQDAARLDIGAQGEVEAVAGEVQVGQGGADANSVQGVAGAG